MLWRNYVEPMMVRCREILAKIAIPAHDSRWNRLAQTQWKGSASCAGRIITSAGRTPSLRGVPFWLIDSHPLIAKPMRILGQVDPWSQRMQPWGKGSSDQFDEVHDAMWTMWEDQSPRIVRQVLWLGLMDSSLWGRLAPKDTGLALGRLSAKRGISVFG